VVHAIKLTARRRSLALLVTLLLSGCQEKTVPNSGRSEVDPDAERKSNLAALAPEDRGRAEGQEFCPVMPDIRLGEMGPPHKVELNGKTLFVCCENCVRQAREEPDKTLAELQKILEARAKETKGERPGTPK
jgi:hypothetical protein